MTATAALVTHVVIAARDRRAHPDVVPVITPLGWCTMTSLSRRGWNPGQRWWPLAPNLWREALARGPVAAALPKLNTCQSRSATAIVSAAGARVVAAVLVPLGGPGAAA